MKKIILLIPILWLTLNTLSGQSQKQVLNELDDYLVRTSNHMGNCPYAVVVSKNGKIIHEKYHDGGGVVGPVNEDSRWHLFSISKSFVSALMLKLAQEGVINLDDPIGNYLPAFETKGDGAFDRRDVTIRHLASHTSGTTFNRDKTPSGFPEDLSKIEIVTEPGGPFLYSGVGMYLLELTLEAATGQDLDDLLKERVLKPLGLTSTGYVYDEENLDGHILPMKPDVYSFSKKGQRASSGLFTTARDLNAFGNFWINPEKKFSKELRDEAWKLHGTSIFEGGHYGLLWWLFADHGGYVMSGYQHKVNAVVPEKNVVVTVIRYPQNTAYFEKAADKHAFVSFGNRL
jgi:CubicO group peptidase (beta-lactamase class C family)